MGARELGGNSDAQMDAVFLDGPERVCVDGVRVGAAYDAGVGADNIIERDVAVREGDEAL